MRLCKCQVSGQGFTKRLKLTEPPTSQVFLKDLLSCAESFSSHEEWIYIADNGHRRILRWKPFTSEVETVAEHGMGIELGSSLLVSVSPLGRVVVADLEHDLLLALEDGTHHLLLATAPLISMRFAPDGLLYLLDSEGTRVQRVNGSSLEPVLSQERFVAYHFYISNESIYLSESSGRILCFQLSTLELTTIFRLEGSNLAGLTLFKDTIFTVDLQRKSCWSFRKEVCQEILDLSGLLELLK